MPLATTKIVQAYIQGLIEVVRKLREADALGQNFKTKFTAKNPDLSGTNITQAQINAVNTFLSELNILANSNITNAILNKDQPSHGKEALN